MLRRASATNNCKLAHSISRLPRILPINRNAMMAGIPITGMWVSSK